ncbi:hypothetical protein G6F68_011193 [Rhizopus microsporus]|nr:hypothetical protein G6F68_011193 [Rhizopus microsporus]
MMTSGTPQTTISTLVECDQSGVYFALVLPARNRQANTKDQVALGEPDHALRIQQHPVTARQAEAGQGDQRQADAVPADIHWRSTLLKKRA